MEAHQDGAGTPSSIEAPAGSKELSNGDHETHTLEKVDGKGPDEEKPQSHFRPANHDHNAVRGAVDKVFSTFSNLIHASLRPLPTETGDGTYIENTVPSGLWEDLTVMGIKDAGTLIEVMKAKHSGSPIDDKTYLMERVIQLASGLPMSSKNRVDLTNSFIRDLWDSLPHPPQSFIGFGNIYRQADGSGNVSRR